VTPVTAATFEELALLPHVVAYEWRKATAFRGGFIVNGVLRGLARPAVMGFVYAAMFESAGVDQMGGYTFAALVHYLVWTAVIQKCMPDWRSLDLAEQIFDGYVTKFLIMPVSYFTLLWGRFVQFLGVQVVAALVFWVAGAVLARRWWPYPVSGTAFAQAAILVALGTCCYWLTFFILNALAFWLDVVWSLLNMFQFVAGFVSGLLVPVALMPKAVGRVFEAFFPYWAVNAPIEILLGRRGTGDFVVGLVVLVISLVALNAIAVRAWRRGLHRYAGAGT
jgi:ABC-2 type transport system permease protein